VDDGKLPNMAATPQTPTGPRLLVLWDIDHTLIETRGVGRAIYDRAFPAATGKPLAELADISGRTELDIMRESLRVNGIDPTDQIVRKLMDALTQGYEDARDELRETGRALPGADETLRSLAAEPNVFQTVLTGNLRAVARVKLEVFGLAQYLDLDAGAYGNDDPERPKLVAIAQSRASERAGTAFSNESTVLVGDTPKDVEAGLAAGVQVIAVTTGKAGADELRQAGAPAVVSNMADFLSVLARFH
jgi:phosphoglycolate phosphatase